MVVTTTIARDNDSPVYDLRPGVGVVEEVSRANMMLLSASSEQLLQPLLVVADGALSAATSVAIW